MIAIRSCRIDQWWRSAKLVDEQVMRYPLDQVKHIDGGDSECLKSNVEMNMRHTVDGDWSGLLWIRW